jgi:hypothetical protein
MWGMDASPAAPIGIRARSGVTFITAISLKNS